MYREISDGSLIALLKAVGLEKYADKEALDALVTEKGQNFSGGERKRICLARALLRDTEILIMDEPLANLDRDTADKVEDLLLQIEDRTVLIVSHQFSEAKKRLFDEIMDLG